MSIQLILILLLILLLIPLGLSIFCMVLAYNLVQKYESLRNDYKYYKNRCNELEDIIGDQRDDIENLEAKLENVEMCYSLLHKRLRQIKGK